MLSQDFIDILAAFSEEKVEYMVVGSYAMAFHGYVRATGDIDLWIRISKDNAEKVWRALKKFGAPLLDLTIDDLQTPDTVYQMGVAPNRIDIINKISGVDFNDAWKNRTAIEIEEITVPLIGKEHLIANKKAADRVKDHSDVIWLESNNNDST